MKVHIEIDCTPEEARSFMGLPDVGKANDVYVDMMSKAMKGVNNTEQLQEYAKQLAPMGQAGFKLFQSFMEGAVPRVPARTKRAATRTDRTDN